MAECGSIPPNDEVCQRAGPNGPRSPSYRSARSPIRSTFPDPSSDRFLLDRYLQQKLLTFGFWHHTSEPKAHDPFHTHTSDRLASMTRNNARRRWTSSAKSLLYLQSLRTKVFPHPLKWGRLWIEDTSAFQTGFTRFNRDIDKVKSCMSDMHMKCMRVTMARLRSTAEGNNSGALQ